MTNERSGPAVDASISPSGVAELNTVIDQLSTADTSADVVAAMLLAFGPGASLFMIDHDLVEISFVADERTTPLDGDLADAMADAIPIEIDESWWLPIPERDNVAFGVFFASAPSAADRRFHVRRSLQLGVCTPALRSRFEDFEHHRRNREMSIAAELQWSLLPPRAGTVGGFNFASALAPAYEIAGDLFEYAYFDDALWVYSLDAMGHGLEATMSGVIALTTIRNARRQGASIDEQMSAANRTVHEQWGGHRFITAVGCRLTADAVHIVNAGHEPARRRQGDVVAALELTPSLPLGVDQSTTYEVHMEPALGSDDSLILLSDGSAEARDASGTAFGAHAVDNAIASSWSASPLRTARSYLRRVVDFAGGDGPNDDVTVVVVSVEPNARQKTS